MNQTAGGPGASGPYASNPYAGSHSACGPGDGGQRVLGVDVGGSSVKMGVLDQDGGVAGVSKAESIANEPEKMVELICRLASGYGADIVGVGTAGMVNHKTGLVTASNLGWSGLALRRMLEGGLNKPVWVDNDAQAALMAEVHSGVCAGARCAVYVSLGTGVGGALLIDGKPWRGGDNTAFELGHIITHADGVPCTCGRRGCFEGYASSTALSRMAGGKSARAVIDGAVAGNPEDCAIFEAYIHELGIGLISAISLFNPEVVAIGGGVSAAGDALIGRLRREMEENYFTAPGAYDVRIEMAAHRNNAGMIGAAALAALHLA